MAKKKTQRKTTPKKNLTHSRLKIINYLLLILVIALSATLISYYFLLQDKQTPKQKIQTPIKTSPKTEKSSIAKEVHNKLTHVEKAFEEYTDEFTKDYTHEAVPEITTPKPTEKPILKPKVIQSNKPKIAIVIDDVTLKSQVRKIENIDYKINMSFMPPTKLHPNSANIAHGLPFYMIHFPMQASNFKYEEENTLHIGDSYAKIEEAVKRIKQAYPSATFTNNHTGSKFTADHDSMDKLFRALKKYNFSFLDSRTTSKTVAKQYAKKYDVPFLARNIFLDNKQEYNYILGQLKKTINIAQKTGYAIAIGHPHSITLKVLKESKELLKDFEMVYVSELPLEKI